MKENNMTEEIKTVENKEEKPQEIKVSDNKQPERKANRPTNLTEEQICLGNPVKIVLKSRVKGVPDQERNVKQLVNEDFDKILKIITNGVLNLGDFVTDNGLENNKLGTVLIFFELIRKQFTEFLIEFLEIDENWFNKSIGLADYLEIVAILLEQNEVDRIVENFSRIWRVLAPALKKMKKKE